MKAFFSSHPKFFRPSLVVADRGASEAGLKSGDKRLWARCGAKQIDIILFGVPAALLFGNALNHFFILTPELPALFSRVLAFVLILAVPLIVIEPLLIARFGATPGKWLMGLRVRREPHGENLTYRAALRRSINCFFFGFGAGIPVIALLPMMNAYLYFIKNGRSRWDQLVSAQISSENRVKWRLLVPLTGICVALLMITLMVRLNALEPDDDRSAINRAAPDREISILPAGVSQMTIEESAYTVGNIVVRTYSINDSTSLAEGWRNSLRSQLISSHCADEIIREAMLRLDARYQYEYILLDVDTTWSIEISYTDCKEAH